MNGRRSWMRLTLLIAPLLVAGTGPVPMECLELDEPVLAMAMPQEATLRVRIATQVSSAADLEADSVGWYAEGNTASVVSCTGGWCQVRYATTTGFVPDSVLVGPLPGPAAAPRPRTAPSTRPALTPAPRRVCCRVCSRGKACGNSCIARNLTCRQPRGCACNGGDLFSKAVGSVARGAARR